MRIASILIETAPGSGEWVHPPESPTRVVGDAKAFVKGLPYGRQRALVLTPSGTEARQLVEWSPPKKGPKKKK